jgi:hypothetical protein
MQAPRSPLAGRYRFAGSFRSVPGAEQWAALDADTGRHVIVARVPANRVVRIEAIKGEKHLYLAGVLDVVRDPAEDCLPGGLTLPRGAALAIAEFVTGRTLQGLLRAGPVHPFKAVAWLLRLVDAVQAIHSRGGAHGAISPRVIVVEPIGRAIAPVLGQLVSPALGAYCSPERLAGIGPSATDDVWALYATLYAALTATAPFPGGPAAADASPGPKAKSLTEFGISEPVLDRLLGRGLALDRRERTGELTYLAHALDAWERGRQPDPPPPAPHEPIAMDKVSEDLIVLSEADLGPQDSLEVPEEETARMDPGQVPGLSPPRGPQKPAVRAAPPPLPVASPVVPAQRPSPPPRRWPVLAAIAIGAVLLAAGSLYFTLSRPRPAPAVAEPAVPGDGSVIPMASSSAAPSPAEGLAACVKSYFPADTFEGPVEFGFLCQDDDLRSESAALFVLAGGREAADAGGGKSGRGAGGLVVRGSKQEDVGWYELLATTIVRSTCCRGAALPVLPKTDGWCQQLQAEVRNVAEATRKSGDLGPYTRRFDDAVVCLYATGTSRPYRYEKAPNEAQRKAFQVFLKNAAETDGARARMSWLK